MRSILTLFLLLYPCTAYCLLPPASVEADAVSSTAIRCYWLPSAGAAGYRVLRDGVQAAVLPASARQYTDTGLQRSHLYTYTVLAVGKNGQTAAAPPYQEETFTPFPDHAPRNERTWDVVVMQASSAGWAAAISAARHGMRVALVEPSNRVGGMPVNGLSMTDLFRVYHMAGPMLAVWNKVRDLYAAEGIKTSGHAYSPRIALQAMRSILYNTPGITLIRHARLARVYTRRDADGLRHVTHVRIAQLNAQGRATGRQTNLYAKVFIDATDCGDLAAWAGAPFRLGREARSAREPHAGVIYYDHATDSLLPGSTGKGDNRLMSYAYLLVVRDYGDGSNHTLPHPPPGYNPNNYMHSPPWKQSWAYTSGKLPDNEYELNQHPQGNDWQGINYQYPVDNYKQRRRIETLYKNHVLGYLYYLQTVQGMKQLGLPGGDYRDSSLFPPLLYVREGRRILGQQVPEEWDITHAREVVRPNAMGIGDYPMDSHACEPKRNWNRPDMGEGEYWLYKETHWHQMPAGILLPRKLDNVWVCMAVSSTHVCFGTYRLEAGRMEFGEAAGAGAALDVRYGFTAPQTPFRQIQQSLIPTFLHTAGDPSAMLYYFADVHPGSRDYRAIEYMACRGFAAGEKDFHPSAPTTRGELIRWLTLLAERTRPALQNSYYGRPASQKALKALQSWPDPQKPVTRAQAALWLSRLLRWHPAANAPRYADITEAAVRHAADCLAAHSIVSSVWDSWSAYSPDGRVMFHPNAVLRHDDMMETLFLAQIGIGPAFGDNPVDDAVVKQQSH